MPDYPDWQNVGVTASQSLILFVVTEPINTPVDTTIDVSLYASVDIMYNLGGAPGGAPARIHLDWIIAGAIVFSESLAIWPATSLSAANYNSVSVPCHGDLLHIVCDNLAAGQQPSINVIGSTRQIDGIQYSGAKSPVNGIMAGGSQVPLAGSGQASYYFGPCSGPFTVILQTFTQVGDWALYVAGYDVAGAILGGQIAGGVQAAALVANLGTFNAPNCAMQLVIANGSASAANFLPIVFGGQ